MQKYWKDVTIHPGVVLGDPHPDTGKFPVAMISTKLPNNPPQKPINTFYHGSDLRGNIRLDPPKHIENAKPWKNEKTGGRQSPMSHADMEKLREAMGAQFTSRSTFCYLFINAVPHQGWRSPPLPASPPPSPKGKPQNLPQQRQRPLSPQQVNAHASGSKLPVPARQHPPNVNTHASSSRPPSVPAVPQWRKRPLSPQQVNAHANGSKLPVPAGQHPPHVNAHASSSRPPPVPAVPQWRKRPLSPQQVNAHANGSKLPVPAGQHPPHVNTHASSSRPPPVPARGPHNQGAPWRKPNPPHVQEPRPQGTVPQRNPAPASLPRRPPSPAGRSPTSQSTGKGKQPIRGKREFIRRRAVGSEY